MYICVPVHAGTQHASCSHVPNDSFQNYDHCSHNCYDFYKIHHESPIIQSVAVIVVTMMHHNSMLQTIHDSGLNYIRI